MYLLGGKEFTRKELLAVPTLSDERVREIIGKWRSDANGRLLVNQASSDLVPENATEYEAAANGHRLL